MQIAPFPNQIHHALIIVIDDVFIIDGKSGTSCNHFIYCAVACECNPGVTKVIFK